MARTLRKYALIYLEFLRTGLAAASSFRLHFVLVVLMDQLFYAASLLTVDFLYDQVATIGPWGRAEFLFFVSFMLAVDQLHMTFISENFWEFSEDLRTGRLDFTLLKPINPLFPSFLRYVRAPSLLNLPLPWIGIVYFGRQAGLEPLSWVLVPLLVPLALAVQVTMELLITMVMFKTIESWGVNFLRIQLQMMSRWPDFIFRGPARLFFTTAVPVLLIGSPPVRFLFDPTDPRPLLAMVAAIAVFAGLVALAWHQGLKRYESASS